MSWSTQTFTTQEQVQRYTQISFTSTTDVTDAELLEFAEAIARAMTAEMAIIGHTRTTLDLLTDPEATLLEETNAIGCAWLAITSTFWANRSPNRTTLGENLAKLYERSKKKLLQFLRKTALDLKSTDHIQSGAVQARTPTDVPVQGDIPFGYDEDL